MMQIARLGLKQPLRIAFAAFAVVLALGAAPVPAADNAPAAPVVEKDPEAMVILMKMADYLAKAQLLGVTVVSGYDSIQEDGERIEFGEKRRIELQRPDRLRVDVERSDGDRGMLVFDGKALTAVKPENNVYAIVEKSGSTDDALVYLVKNLRIKMPLARMFLSTFPADLEKQVESIAYVETNNLFDVPTDHLAVRGTGVDFQLWITQGDAPLPRRVVITYKDAPGQPQFRAYFSDWTVGKAPAADRFTFTPPAGAERVPFIIPARGQKPAEPVKEGAK
jgi:hypothetical protein